MGYQHFEGLLRGGLMNYYRYTKVVNGMNEDVANYATTETVDDAIEWLNGGEGHWFLWMAFNAPHTPFHVPPANLHQQTLPEDPNCPDGEDLTCFRSGVNRGGALIFGKRLLSVFLLINPEQS